MSRSSRYILSLILLWSLGFSAIAQPTVEIREALSALRSYYADNGTVLQELDYVLYASHDSDEIHSSEKGRMIFGPEGVYTELGPIRSIETKEYSLAIDELQGIVMLSDAKAESITLPMDDLEAYMELIEDLRLVQKSDAHHCISYSIPFGPMSNVEIHYDPTDHRMIKLCSYYREETMLDEAQNKAEAPRIEIVYTHSETQYDLNGELDLRAYLSIGDSQITLQNEVMDYQFIDNRAIAHIKQNEQGP